MATTAVHEPPTRGELEEVRQGIRKLTVAVKPGGIGLRWQRLSVPDRVRLVDLANTHGAAILRNREARHLIAKGSGECWWPGCVEEVAA